MTSEIVHGDCIQEMKQMQEESVDAVVTDPPYGLAFMGKSWDEFEPKEFQEFSRKWGEQALRVLKPGSYLLAFSGTRTYHRMVTGLEDAGFEIKDQIDWLYGCLSEDTKILTKDGWEDYEKIQEGSEVVAFDPQENKLELEDVEKVFRYNHDGLMVRLFSRNTNQLVTPNHRVLVRENNEWKTIKALRYNGCMELLVGDNYDKRKSLRLSNRNGMRNLWREIQLYRGLGSKEKENLFGRVQEQADFKEEKKYNEAEGGKGWFDKNFLRLLWKNNLEIQKNNEEKKSTVLWYGLLQSMEERERRKKETFERNSSKGRDVGGSFEKITKEDEGGKQPRLEGRSDLSKKERKLWCSEIYSLPRRVYGYGSGRRLCDGASFKGSEGVGTAVKEGASCPSQEWHPVGQSPGES